ncbi:MULTISPECIES: hypothetical protein [Olivibacter]|uniref:Uncharacterized protein n=1 Tax=Olivibacter jilunii TaxID=985016 RepID=A0ABW6AWZ8_9SPHI
MSIVNTYTLNNKNIRTSYRIIPAMSTGSFIALSGAWDMPSRIGTTHRDWGYQGIEPYVNSDEIRFGGRDIDFYGVINSISENDALRQCYALYKDIDSFTGLVPLTSSLFGTWNVYVRGEITGTYLHNGTSLIHIPFREPIVDLSGEMPRNILDFSPINVGGLLLDGSGFTITVGQLNNDGYGIDGYMFKSLGLYVIGLDGRYNRPAPKTGQFISYNTEGYKITKTGLREITLRAAIDQPNYNAFKSVLKGLCVLFKKEGLRYITKKNDALRDFFVKDGFQVTNIKCYGGRFTALISIKMTEVNSFTDWNVLNTSKGQFVQSDIGNIIIT